MRRYYTRFFKEVIQSVFTFWKTQVVGGLLAGVITAIVDSGNGVTQSTVARASVSAVVYGYLVLLGIAIIYSVIRAPFKLDEKRVLQLSNNDSSLQIQIQENERLQKLLAAPQVSPVEQERREFVIAKLKDASKDQITVWKYILRQGSTDPADLLHGKRHGVSNDNAVHQVLSDGMLAGLLNSASGSSRHVTVKTEYLAALEWYLHDRPVAPPTA